MTTPKLTESIIRARADRQTFERGQTLHRNHAIANPTIQGSTLKGECAGTQAPYYTVRVELDGGGVRTASCTCPDARGVSCKHIVALLLAYVDKPGQFAQRKEPQELLAGLTREQMLALLTKLLHERPELSDWLETSLTHAAQKAQAAKPKQVDTSAYRRRVRGIMHSLDRMRPSEAYWHVGGVTNQLGEVETTALEFLNAGDAESALQILLALVDESSDGFDYIDDSDGELASFFDSVGETLAEVILSMELDEDRREDLVSDLDEAQSQLSDYGVDGLGVAIAAARYGWNALPSEERLEKDDADDDEWDDDDDEFETSYLASSWRAENAEEVLTRVKLNILERQGRRDEFLALCLKTGAHGRYALKLCELERAPEAVKYALKHFVLADDALKLAQWLREAGLLDEAIKLGERGLQLGGSKAALGEWLGPIQEAQGRTKQALEAWQTVFRERPSLTAYQTLKRLAGARWKSLKPELMAVLEKGYDRQALVEILLFEQDWDAACKIADEKHAYYTIVRTVADALIPHRPEWVIRACKKQADELIAKTQSKYYGHAADWLRKVKAAYAQLGRTAEWEKYLAKLKEEYRRRPALQAQLRSL
jgi:uncharacterized Zn finger protein